MDGYRRGRVIERGNGVHEKSSEARLELRHALAAEPRWFKGEAERGAALCSVAQLRPQRDLCEGNRGERDRAMALD